MLLLLVLQCKESPAKHVVVSIETQDGKQYSITVKNQSEKEIIINRFSSGIASLVLERQSNGKEVLKVYGSPPPIPPKHFEKYDTLLKNSEQITISLQGVEALNNMQNAKIRAKIFYKIQGENKYRTEHSDWITVEETSKK